MATVEPIDIWRAAKIMVDAHGDLAVIECALKADDLAERGDIDGQIVWLAIRRAVKSLLEDGPPPDVTDPADQIH